MTCPLCSAKTVADYCRDTVREYLRCDRCGLVFVPGRFHLSPEDEKKRYDLHRNAPDDPGYRGFLNRLFIPVNERLAPASTGLDFGSGPEPLLSRMFGEAGHTMRSYDPFYGPFSIPGEQRFDFITASEVVEHLRQPRKELDQLWALLRPGGFLGIMTQPLVEQSAFPAWHYKNDRTHILFFSPPTFLWLAEHWGADLTFPEKDLVIFRKRRA
ncbi:MAG: class I SAM-dependent methyltransferase [Nitrospirota bacterium]|nr:class I SAM-dependent methyltransferase [Nitrospirota bacterium]